ncbi:MAG: ribosome recycling factor [Elusimicrobia bacterium]|nr:ribosome recycling factor [Elusimicrobiota bacterium]MBI3013075.1 ribosome recycling factor [Elusimicrobiota bacterium]
MNPLQSAEEQMKKVIERFKSELASLRTGRAHISLLEGIKVDYYGSSMTIQQLASCSVVEGRTLEIKPWDKESLKAVEQAILKSDLGMSPMNDGKLLRLNVPTLTTERRKDLIRVVRKQAEDFRVAVRNIRREIVENVKAQEKEKMISQDDVRRLEQEVQKLTDHSIRSLEDILSQKEKEILES